MSFETALINGIAVGSVSALLAVGISQIFAVTGVLNFAHAGFAMVAAYLYSWFTTEQGWPAPGAALASIVIVTLLGALLEGLVLGSLHSAPPPPRSVHQQGDRDVGAARAHAGHGPPDLRVQPAAGAVADQWRHRHPR